MKVKILKDIIKKIDVIFLKKNNLLILKIYNKFTQAYTLA